MKASTYASLMLNFAKYNECRSLGMLKAQLDQIYFGAGHKPHQWFLTANGRTAIYLFLKSHDLPEGSEVIVQSFTCVTAVNPVIWAGLKPIYADIDAHTLSAAPDSLQKLVSPRTRVIMLQHTFGVPGALQAFQALAREHNLIILEDCAHALGGKTNGQAFGTFGDAAIISFGIEKSLSTKLGGALLINNPNLVRSVEANYRQLPNLNRWQTFLWLLYPGLRQFLRKLPPYIAKPSQKLFESVGLLKTAVSKAEYTAGRPKAILAALPGVHAKIILDALASLDSNLTHRQQISSLYQEWLGKNVKVQTPTANQPLIKFPLICQSTEVRDAIATALAEKEVYVTDWYRPPIYPAGVNYQAIGYNSHDCPEAESIAERILNLPTGQNIDTRHATMVANVVNAATTKLSG